ncbi:hypothetical protein PENTCL1PPCAC_12917, partial [Pristionchus entomophagus]
NLSRSAFHTRRRSISNDLQVNSSFSMSAFLSISTINKLTTSSRTFPIISVVERMNAFSRSLPKFFNTDSVMSESLLPFSFSLRKSIAIPRDSQTPCITSRMGISL